MRESMKATVAPPVSSESLEAGIYEEHLEMEQGPYDDNSPGNDEKLIVTLPLVHHLEGMLGDTEAQDKENEV